MDKQEAIEAARRSGLTERDASDLVLVAEAMGTAVAESNGTMVVCAGGNFAVETLDQIPAVGW